MTNPMKIQAKLSGDVCDIRVLATHPMESGLRKDDSGKVVPAHFIQSITVALNGKTVVTGQTGGSVSRNPLFGFKVRGAKAGDKVTVTWTDNKGDKRTDEATIS